MIFPSIMKKNMLAAFSAGCLFFSLFAGVSLGAIVAPASLAFGTSNNVGVSTTKTVSITNSGASFEVLSAITVTGTNSGDFTIANDTCSNKTINAGSVCTLDLIFTPSALGSRTASLNVNSTVSTALTGTGISTINGTIIDLSTGLPLANATVTATLPGGTSPLTATTKTDGSFSLANTIAYGAYDVTLSKIDYSGYSVNIGTISATQGRTLKLGMAPMGLLNIVTTTPLIPASTFVDTINITGGVGPYNFKLVSYTSIPPTLPPGLVLDSSIGTITGVPTTAGTYKFTIGVSDSVSGYAEREYTVNIPVISTDTYLPRATQGVAYSSLITAQSPTSLTFSCTPPGSATPVPCSLPTGLSLGSTSGTPATGFTASITGTPSITGAYNVVVYATESGGRSYKTTFQIYVEAPLAMSTTTLPKGAVNAPYSQTLVASGGFPPYSWSISTGTLPTGLTLNSATGLISGTPSQIENQTFTVTLNDYLGRNIPVSKSLTVEVVSQLALVTTTLSRGMKGVVYSATLAASGGVAPYSYSLASGNILPTGLTLNKTTGVISGTPTVDGSVNVAIVVTDAASSPSSSQILQMIIDPALSITTTSPQVGLINTPYTFSLTATGGINTLRPSYIWAVTSGSLPNGIALDSSTGALSGTAASSSTTTITVMVIDDFGRTATKVLTLNFAGPLILTSTVARGIQNVAYSAQLAVTGGTTPYKYALASGTLPGGIVLNATTGVLSGTPTASGSFPCSFLITDAVGRTTNQSITITIDASLAITTTLLADGAVNVVYSQTLAATGGFAPYTWSVPPNSLPAGLVLDSVSGVISGTPSDAVRPAFTVTVIDANSRTASRQFSISLPLTLATTIPATGSVGVAYTATATASGGLSPYSYSLTGTPPPGVTINSTTGVISGTPTQSGTYNFSVKVVDVNGRSATSASPAVTITPAFYISTSSLNTVIANTAYSQTLTVFGGVAPYTWSIVAGSLTTGLTLNPATGIISGTPTTDITQSVTIKVVDTNGLQASKQFIPPLKLHTVSMPDGTPGSSYSEYIVVSGGIPPYSVTLTGQLPAGLTLNPTTGFISGTPSVAGYTTAGIKIVDSSTPGTQSISVTFGIRIWAAPSILSPSNSLSAQNAVSIKPVTMIAEGGTTPYRWTVLSGTLPPGLSLSPDGILSGTPTVTGDYAPVIQALDSSAAPVPAQKAFYIHVDETIPADINLGDLNQAYDGKPKNVSVTTAPSGLDVVVTYNGSSTAPVAAGSYSVIATINDITYRGSASGTLIINEPAGSPVLSVTVSGSGTDTVYSDPAAINCSVENTGVCSQAFSARTDVTLHATPSALSVIDGWTGCTSTDATTCMVTMDANKTITATFKLAPKAMVDTAPYNSLNEAYKAVASSATILLLDTELSEGLSIKDKNLILKGGYSTDFKSRSGSQTVLSEGLSVLSGDSTMEAIDVKGIITIQGGSLLINGVTIK